MPHRQPTALQISQIFGLSRTPPTSLPVQEALQTRSRGKRLSVLKHSLLPISIVSNYGFYTSPDGPRNTTSNNVPASSPLLSLSNSLSVGEKLYFTLKTGWTQRSS